MIRLAFVVALLALAGCTTLARFATVDLDNAPPWDCGASPADSAAPPATGEAGTSPDGTGSSN